MFLESNINFVNLFRKYFGQADDSNRNFRKEHPEAFRGQAWEYNRLTSILPLVNAEMYVKYILICKEKNDNRSIVEARHDHCA